MKTFTIHGSMFKSGTALVMRFWSISLISQTSPADYHLFEHIGFSMRKERFRYSEEVVDAFEQIIKAKDELFF